MELNRVMLKLVFKLSICCWFVLLCEIEGIAQTDSIALPVGKKSEYRLLNIPSRNALNRQLQIYTVAVGATLAIVYPLKNITNVERPDKSNNRSFPSGHAALAFASAEFVRHEYWETSPWIGVGAYGVATAVAAQRVTAHRHSVTDVIVGAGIGALSAVASSWLNDLVFKKTFLSSQKSQ